MVLRGVSMDGDRGLESLVQPSYLEVALHGECRFRKRTYEDADKKLREDEMGGFYMPNALKGAQGPGTWHWHVPLFSFSTCGEK